MTRAAAKLSPWPPWPREWNGGPVAPLGPPALAFAFDCKTVNEANASGPSRWPTIARRKAVREATTEALSLALNAAPLPLQGPWCVRLTRRSPSRLDPEAVALALKMVQDVLAEAIGVDDGSDAIAFCYAQEKGKPLGVRVEVWGGGAARQLPLFQEAAE